MNVSKTSATWGVTPLLLLVAWAGVGVGGCDSRPPEENVYSTAAALQAGITSGFTEEKAAIGGVGREWKVLSDEEYEALVPRVAARRFIPGYTKGQVLKDAWGRPLKVAIKDDDVVVWSDGPDGQTNTEDDVKSPREFYGALPVDTGAATRPEATNAGG